jgi:hypothetical protein
MTQLYDEISKNAEKEINKAVKKPLRKVPVIGKKLASAVPTFRLPAPPGSHVSFQNLMNDLRRRGVRYVNMNNKRPFHSFREVAHNAAQIKKQLMGSPKRDWVIVSHSKGGLDTLAALLSMTAKERERVKGWVALQAPFHGSPLADDVRSPVTALLLKALGGKQQALTDLTIRKRSRYMKSKEKAIRALVKQVPIISWYSSFKPDRAAGLATMLKAVAKELASGALLRGIARIVKRNPFSVKGNIKKSLKLVNERVNKTIAAGLKKSSMMDLAAFSMHLNRKRLQSDGMVPVSSTRLAGLPRARHRKGPTADHASPAVCPPPFIDYWSDAKRASIPWGLVNELTR